MIRELISCHVVNHTESQQYWVNSLVQRSSRSLAGKYPLLLEIRRYCCRHTSRHIPDQILQSFQRLSRIMPIGSFFPKTEKKMGSKRSMLVSRLRLSSLKSPTHHLLFRRRCTVLSSLKRMESHGSGCVSLTKS